ncbi:hypothetical protein [Blastococcus sp. TF02A-35]|uniref:HAAS signaling domain-containing protein n=1 Tax=Blastococcus sp. TF02A-35 TaxID=2559612 RepID=UPI001073B468|nr:hypothetical protein [Blastococcus sp. TF02A_35]TFV51989.1 hypothetical protein E4P43_08040 [Blastococcus sp. TF02A_35]
MSAPSAPSRTRQAQDYLAAVEHELADLPAEDRGDLVEDLAMHLDALAAEDDDRDIAVRLGPPAVYAEELRAAAGLPARGAGGRSPAPGLRERIDGLVASEAFQRARPALRETRRLLVELRPAWWVLRGYLLVFVPSAVLGDHRDFPVPAPLGSHVLGVLLVAAAVVGSVHLGRRATAGQRPGRRLHLVTAGGGVLLALWGLALVSSGSVTGPEPVYGYDYATAAPEQAMGQYPLLNRYGPVTNVFPYAADGTPLEDVLLYDQDGRPLEVGFQEWWADGCYRVPVPPRAADGAPVEHAFPQAYELEPYATSTNGCLSEVPRPAVPLPVIPSDGAAEPTPMEPAPTEEPVKPVAPAPGD